MNLFGIDTVTIVTEDFQFDLQKNINCKTPLLLGNLPRPLGTEIKESVLLKDVNGIEIKGDYLRPQNAINETGVLNIAKLGNSENPSLKLQLSVPKFLTKENYLLAESEDIKNAIKEINNTLCEIGIYTDVSQGHLSRLDVTKNIESEYPPNMYVPVFRMLSASRMKDTEHNGGETFTKINGSREICFYDKRKEMIDSNLSVKDLPINVLRNEYRVKKTDSVIKTYDVNSFYDVYKRFDDVKDIYRNELKDKMFKSPFLDIEKTNDVMQIFWSCMENSGKGKANFYERGLLQIFCNQNKAIIENISEQKVLELYEDYLKGQGYDRNTISVMKSRQRTQIRKINEKMFACMDITESVTMQDLYNELYTKFLAA